MLAFSSARRAVACARAIQQAVGAAFTDSSPRIAVRIGVHTGEALHEGDHFFGTTVHYAARVASNALGDEVLVSSVVHDLVAVPTSNSRRAARWSSRASMAYTGSMPFRTPERPL